MFAIAYVEVDSGFVVAFGGRCSYGLNFDAFGAGFAGLRFRFSPASAICFRFAGVAPVRGGTYFSLPRQRKVGKRKPLTPPMLVLTHGLSTSPRLARQRVRSFLLPTLFSIASPASRVRISANRIAPFAPLCGKRCVGFRAAQETIAVRCALSLLKQSVR